MKRKFLIITASIITAALAVITAVSIVSNAPFYEMRGYIRDRHSIVTKIKFTNYHSPYCSFDFYVEPDCTYEQARAIFEDFANHMSNEFTEWARNKTSKKAFLDADFINSKTELIIYSFETGDLENFVHWEVEYGGEPGYKFDRTIS